MSIRNVALIFDDQLRPDTTGVYCKRALGEFVNVRHFLPQELSGIPRNGFDLYLNIDDGMEYRLPNDLRPCAWWAIDTHLNLEWCLNRSADFDFLFVAQRDGNEQFQEAGMPSVWLPLACDPRVHVKYDAKKEFDACFIGHIFPGPREDLVRLIQSRFPNHFVGRRFFEDMARTYSSSRTVFNRSIRNDINMRVFEALACGSLLVTNDLRDNGQEDLFRDGIHLATYRTAEELLDKIGFYLRHDAEREKIAAAGRAEVLAKDTYRHRMEFLLCEVERGVARALTWPIRAAGANSAFPGDLERQEPDRPEASTSRSDPAGNYLVDAQTKAHDNHGLTSIIIVTYNQCAYTKQCLASIRRYTDEPYELILVDNGSTDGTKEYLQSVANARVITNKVNRGFPAAANQGIHAASGQQILLLNNDTLVTPGWIRRLLQALYSDEKIGLAGPCSNCVSGQQEVTAAYEDLAGLDEFASGWAKANERVLVETSRLVGFCLLIRKEVIDEIGLLDERFGVGCFEDDDFCLRAIRAGYRAVIVRDAFVHHFGGQTFRSSGIDFAALMQKNRQLFHSKWKAMGPARGPSNQELHRKEPAEDMDDPVGIPSSLAKTGSSEEIARHGKVSEHNLTMSQEVKPCDPGPSVKPTPWFKVKAAPGGGLLLERNPIILSLCMIVRDNARTIEACLASIRPWVDEMVVVDTGSKDNTPQIALGLGARVYHFPWCDSFSAARNASLHYARGNWIFWMDSDDTIDADNGRELRELTYRESKSPILGFGMQVHCPGPGEDGHNDVTVVDHVKLFRNRRDLRFEGRIHEQILPAIRRAAGEVELTRLFVTHSGYDHSPQGQKKKLDRDFHLLHLELEERPNHPFTLFNLGMTYADNREYEKAANFLNRSIACSGTCESHLRKAYALLVYCYSQLGQKNSASETCQQGLRLFPKDAELRFRKAILLQESGRLQEAAQAYLSVLQKNGDRCFASVDRGIAGFKTRQNLALVYMDLGDWANAQEQWRLVVEEMPRYRQGWRGLGEVLRRQGKQEEALALAKQLQGDRHLHTEGTILKGQLALARADWQSARGEFESAVSEEPANLEAWQALCQFFFEHGDLNDAKAALLELVGRNPQDASAYHNLGTIHMRMGHAREATEAYRQSLRYRPDSPNTFLQLGNAFRDSCQLREAIDAWDQALRLDPGNREAAEALRHEKGDQRQRWPFEESSSPSVTVASYWLKIGDGRVEVSFAARGPVDQAIIRQIWENDVYGVREIAEAPATVVDIGAHIGVFSVMAAETWPSARIIACEADHENFALLQKNLNGRPNIETVEAAIVGEDVSEVAFNAVVDKFGNNSGGGSCIRPEPGSIKTRVGAMSAVKLWRSKNLTVCDLLKLDCEGSEIPILRALSESGLLADVRLIVGEWHGSYDNEEARETVKAELTAILQNTHKVLFKPHRLGREGHFAARAVQHSN
jgi:FkbM family methyltransferase